jgi:hypothetical protein
VCLTEKFNIDVIRKYNGMGHLKIETNVIFRAYSSGNLH